MRIIALHLPQFHEIEENNKWWGEGFTEWTNVKKARALFDGHLQPRVPLGSVYYDLSEKGSVESQMKLAGEYGIDGFCFYHYWFNGKLLLEKPVEMLLENKTLPVEFMLCWANEPWTRTWDGNQGSKQILIEQNYGNEQDWRAHFEYLLSFFKHDSYIKIDDRPVIAIYKASDILQRRKMFTLWNELAKENGFLNGLYILNTHRLTTDKEYPIYGDGVYDFEPFASMKFACQNQIGSMRCGYDGETYFVMDYIKMCERMVRRKVFPACHHNLGFFTGFDNSPRLGKRVKNIFENNTPDIVEQYFHIQYKRSLELGNDFLFINAWNEWAEGAILEPDEKYGYGYLNAIKKVVGDG